MSSTIERPAVLDWRGVSLSRTCPECAHYYRYEKGGYSYCRAGGRRQKCRTGDCCLFKQKQGLPGSAKPL